MFRPHVLGRKASVYINKPPTPEIERVMPTVSGCPYFMS